MFKKVAFFLLLSYSACASPDLSARRIQAHLLLEDTEAAVVEAQEMLTKYPDFSLAYEMLIKSFAAHHEEAEMLRIWNQFHEKFPEKALDRELLEDVCWGILNKGRRAAGLTTQLIALVGAALTQEVRAVGILKDGMNDSNSHIRSVAVQLGSLYGDEPLRQEIIRLFRDERVWEVQEEVLHAIGKLKLADLVPDLIKKASNNRLGAEEKKEIIATITQLKETIGQDELKLLIQSNKAILRILGCEWIAKLELKESVSLLLPLVKDFHPDVRIAALQTCGILRLKPTDEIEQAAMSRDHKISITAGWVLLLEDQKKGEEVLRKWLSHSDEEAKLFAAAAIAAAGKYGIPLAQEYLQTATDPYIRANLALALIHQRVDCEKACQELDQFLQTNQDRWMWGKDFFACLQKSTLLHHPIIPNYPEVMNQTVRLEILNLLAILEYPNVQEAMKRFLKERHWGVTGIAAEILLGEGDENALELVRELLVDPDKHIRTEAALVLAGWGHDPIAFPVLKEAYKEGDRILKIKVLESLGRIRNKDAIPFLIECLQEPHQTLRLISASILIQTLNH